MSASNENAISRIRGNNSGSGSQHMNDGSGDQNVVSDKGAIYKINQLVNLSVPNIKPAIEGMPFTFNGTKRRSHKELTCKDMVAWLKQHRNQAYTDPHWHQQKLYNQVTPGTGKWILKENEIQAWREASSSSRILCLHGKLGSGKTMLTTVIIDSIEKEIRGRNNMKLACAYFYFQEGEKHHASHMWESLLTQLLDRESVDLAAELKKKLSGLFHGSIHIDPAEYFNLFRAQAARFETVYLVIDSLDSCQEAQGEMTQQSLQEALKTLPGNTWLLFTSRSDLFEMEAETSKKLCVVPNEHDVNNYVKKRIKDNRDLNRLLANPEIGERVMDNVSKKAMSVQMFLLARLYMDDLSKQRNMVEINNVLQHLPESQLQAVHVVLERCMEDSVESFLAKRTLIWVMHAKKALRLEQIQESFISWDKDEERYRIDRHDKKLLMSACNGLVIMDPKNETLGLVHEIVQRELEKDILPRDANLEIAKTCLHYLLIDTYEGGGQLPLLQYAATFWSEHLTSDHVEVDPDTEFLVLNFLMDCSKVTRAFKNISGIDGEDGATLNGMTGLHAAVYYDCLSWAELLLISDTNFNIDTQCLDGQTALHWAVRYNRAKFLEWLIQKSANVNSQDNSGNTPLHKALTRPAAENITLIETLIKGKALADIQNAEGISPLVSAIRHGPTSIAKILIESQSDVDAEISKGWTSLRHVFDFKQTVSDSTVKENLEAGEKKKVQLQQVAGSHARFLIDLLLERRVNLNLPSTKDEWTPLVHSINTGDLSSMHQLLKRTPDPADVSLRDSKGRSPLWWAVSSKRTTAIQLLVDHGADINESYGDGSTPLLKAARQKDSSTITQLLVSLGANADMPVASGKSTLLIEAVKIRNRNAALVLLEAGVQIDGSDADGKSALVHAIENQDKTMAWLLLENSASSARFQKDHTARNQSIQRSLQLAMNRNDFSMAWLLCQHGASLAIVDDKGRTFLHRAALSGNLPAVRFLVSHKAAVYTQDQKGFTPLHCGVLSCRDDIVAVLASQATKPSQLDIRDNEGHTALSLATYNRRTAAMKALICHGASCNISGQDGLTTVHLAASWGFLEEMGLLLNGGGDPNAIDDKCSTPLHQAIVGHRAHPDLVTMLKEAGANLEARDKDCRTPLMLAAQLDNHQLVSGLLKNGVDIDAENEDERTAIDYASECSESERLLIQAESRLLAMRKALHPRYYLHPDR